MADTSFTNGVTLTDADWFNDLNRLHYTIFGDPADDAAARTGLGLGALATAASVDDSTIAAATAQTLTDGATVTWDAANGHVGNWTAAGNRTLSNATNVKRGRRYILNFTQDATGGRTINYGSNYKGVNGGGVPQPNPAPSATTTYEFFSPDGTVLQLIAPPVPVYGQCIVTKSGSDLLLSPLNGNLLTINGKVEVIPDAGVTLAATGVSADTNYYIYAYMNSGTMTLERDTTGWARQAGTNVPIKTGDATRTLVALARANGSSAWADSMTERFVASFWNPVPRTLYCAWSWSSAGTAGEPTSADRCKWVQFAADARMSVGGILYYGPGGAQAHYAAVYRDGGGAGAFVGGHSDSAGAGYQVPVAPTYHEALSEGYHYSSLYVSSSTYSVSSAGGANHAVVFPHAVA